LLASLAATATLAVALPSSAAAQSLDVGGMVDFGFGGEVDWEYTVDRWHFDDDDFLDPMLGFGLFARYQLHENFDLGGELHVLWWRTDEMEDVDIDRCTLIDIAVRPMGKYGFANVPLELYLALPIGLTISVPSDEASDAFQRIDSGDIDAGTGINLALLAGLNYHPMPEFGLFVELGWTMHWYVNDLDTARATELESLMNQFALRVGAFWSMPD
jgi:hypothetical protein